MALTGGWKKMHQAENVPERDYRWKIVEYMGPTEKPKDLKDDPKNKWAGEHIRVQLLDELVKLKRSNDEGKKPDKEVVGRKYRIFLGNEIQGWNFGFRDIQKALYLDGDNDAMEGSKLVGLKFDGRFSMKDDKNDTSPTPRQFPDVMPLWDDGWVNEQSGSASKTASKGRKRSSSKSSQSSADRRARRRAQ